MAPDGPETADWAEKKLIGGELCLDFANTVDWHASESPQELLKTYEDLVSWSVRAGSIGDDEARRLLREGKRRPDEASGVLRRAIALREAVYRILVGFITGQGSRPSDWEIVNQDLARAFRRLRLAPLGKGCAWEWTGDEGDLDRMLWPVLSSLTRVLTSEKRERVGQCADDRGCGWLFLDTSKNHRRKWCLMEDCGNRAKALRHQRKRRSGRHSE